TLSVTIAVPIEKRTTEFKRFEIKSNITLNVVMSPDPLNFNQEITLRVPEMHPPNAECKLNEVSKTGGLFDVTCDKLKPVPDNSNIGSIALIAIAQFKTDFACATSLVVFRP
ncbi:22061_t:CDS:2, partial [Dentiscutata erythropus]